MTTLNIAQEEAMALDANLTDGARTVRVQVSVDFVDDNGKHYVATRIVKMRLKPEVKAGKDGQQ